MECLPVLDAEGPIAFTEIRAKEWTKGGRVHPM
jgi:hypothetical protein